MSNITVYNSDDDLREAMADVEDLLADFKRTQLALDEERRLLAEEVQGAIVEMEQRVSGYEQSRDDVDRRLAELLEQRRPFEAAHKQLQQQLDAKEAVKHGKAPADADLGQKQGEREQAAQAPKPSGPVTKADIEKLKSRLSKPKPDLTLDPPGGISQASAIDKDLKLMARAREKQERLNEASLDLRSNWNRSSGPKR